MIKSTIPVKTVEIFGREATMEQTVQNIKWFDSPESREYRKIQRTM